MLRGNRRRRSAGPQALQTVEHEVDRFSLYKPGTIDDILIGRVWTFDITQTWALGALILMTVPSLMLVLTLTLPAAAARWTNLAVASLYVIVSLLNVVGETWLYYYTGAAIEAALLVLVVRYAWSWPRHLEQPAEAVGTRATSDPLNVHRPASA